MKTVPKDCSSALPVLLFDMGAVYLGQWVCEVCNDSKPGYWIVDGEHACHDEDFQYWAKVKAPLA
jgi:hypothetical protein